MSCASRVHHLVQAGPRGLHLCTAPPAPEPQGTFIFLWMRKDGGQRIPGACYAFRNPGIPGFTGNTARFPRPGSGARNAVTGARPAAARSGGAVPAQRLQGAGRSRRPV